MSSLRWLFERGSGAVLRAAGYRRRAVLVGSGANIQAVSHALRESREIEPYGFVARTPEMPKQEELFYTAMITFPKCAPASR